ncbi:hypothetical protein RHMOL_Rhmol03G0040800 [Rhododendron molle]|uniref:Uncharacterized protein n=1 Tax=Rhododendron molle TaxID=49168 RepID=A0ACC0PBD0_RHOML|nr:hypothetical protein RHMOL_Rhmol03G0040800 [Rhododendron molle]
MYRVGKDTRYLALPAFWGWSKAADYNFLLEKALLKLHGWRQKMLNFEGKEVVIKSEVQAIMSYAMASFALPKKLCD